MTASLRQIEANRRNAALSTGPRTEEGKQRSRRNALKHGLAGDGVVLPEEQERAIEARAERWAESFRPADEREAWLVEVVARESVRIDLGHQHEIVLRGVAASRAARPTPT